MSPTFLRLLSKEYIELPKHAKAKQAVATPMSRTPVAFSPKLMTIDTICKNNKVATTLVNKPRRSKAAANISSEPFISTKVWAESPDMFVIKSGISLVHGSGFDSCVRPNQVNTKVRHNLKTND